MEDDIVIRLLEHADEEKKAGAYVLRDALSEAADEIERLRLELEEQRYWNSVLQEQVKYTI